MNKRLLSNNTFLIVIFFCFSSNLSAQKCFKQSADNIFQKFALKGKTFYDSSNNFYVAQHLKSLPFSAKVLRTVHENIDIIEIYNQLEFDNYNNQVKLSQANTLWKFSPSLERKILKENKSLQKFIVVGEGLEEFLKATYRGSSDLFFISSKQDKAIIIKCTHKFLLNKIANLPQVNFIDEYVQPTTEVNLIGYNRSFHGINALDFNLPNANGRNIVVGVKEQKMQSLDLDLYKRVLPSSLAASNIDDHATVISAIIGGAGNSFYNGRGMANACKFFPSSFSNLFVDDASILNQNKVTVQNHSYGTVIQQFYGAEAKSYDEHLWSDKNFLHIFSAGNRGTQSATTGLYNGLTNFANLTGNFKMAKNIITVAAVNDAGIVANESSAGPLYDGRLAPQIAALGPNGTSDAAAMVTGTVAILQQIFRDSNSLQALPASLAKAILYNTTTDIYKEGIDYKTGYGLLNSYEAVLALQQKKYEAATISQGQQWTKNISVPSNATNLKITLAWTDSASQLNNNKAILNDLDLQVQEINSGLVYRPWVLSVASNIDSLNKIPTRKRDSLNTSEQVSIKFPNPGQYEIKIIGFNVPSANMPFHIAINVDTLNTFTFTNPQHTSDVNIQENESLIIKWKTFVADTANQLGNLFISYNAGNNWQLIKQSVKLYKNEFAWLIKDTSSIAVLKMETSFGTYFSKNFIVSRVIRSQVDFLCADSFRLSWNKHVYANGYRIYTLIDSPYLKPILTITDTFKTFKRIDFPNNVYAIEPILSNGYMAARGVAIDINEQGVACFYKAFNYNLLDNNDVELSLALSITEYVDSIFFEEVNEGAGSIQTYGSAKVFNGSLVYVQLASIVNSGITYFRAKLKLKSGAIIYTNIISVLTSGKKRILFYPNPTNVSSGINYVLQQGTFTNNAIQFFDANGRYLKGYKTIPDKINTSLFPTGVIVYKLMNDKSEVLETGKLVLVR